MYPTKNLTTHKKVWRWLENKMREKGIGFKGIEEGTWRCFSRFLFIWSKKRGKGEGNPFPLVLFPFFVIFFCYFPKGMLPCLFPLSPFSLSFSRQTFLYGIFIQMTFHPLWDKASSRREAKKGNRQGFLY